MILKVGCVQWDSLHSFKIERTCPVISGSAGTGGALLAGLFLADVSAAGDWHLLLGPFLPRSFLPLAFVSLPLLFVSLLLLLDAPLLLDAFFFWDALHFVASFFAAAALGLD